MSDGFFSEAFSMPAVTFPHRATTCNAPFNNAWLAQEFLNRRNSAINDKRLY